MSIKSFMCLLTIISALVLHLDLFYFLSEKTVNKILRGLKTNFLKEKQRQEEFITLVIVLLHWSSV